MIERELLSDAHLRNRDLKVTQAAPVKVPFGLPSLHFLMCMVGTRGSGKTTALINLIKSYDDGKVFDKLYMFSPTLRNDPKYELLEKGNYKLKSYTTYTDDIFREVLEEIRGDIDLWKDYEAALKIWLRFKKAKTIEDLSDEDVLGLYITNFIEPVKPFPKFPTSLLIYDDLVGNKELYRADSKGLFNSFVILHRHLGCSCIFLSQIFHSAVPRQIRNNISSWILFASRNSKLKEQIAEELCGTISPERFLELWDTATADDAHSFFMVDADAKEKRFRYRKNLNELLLAGE